ncbi:MAG: glycosyltransferase family 2 protein [Saprospiraceae bacterium]
MSQIEYSVIIPVYRSAPYLKELIARTVATFGQMGKSCEIICVVDGSPDNSWSILKEIKQQGDTPLSLINLSKNVGQHRALLCGLSFSKGKAAILLDADLQTPPEEAVKLIDEYEKNAPDVVYGIYSSKKHPLWRNLGSKFLGWLLHKFGHFNRKGSSFKLLDRTIIDNICRVGVGYIFIDEIMAWFTSNISYVEVEHHENKDGKSTYSLFSLIKMTLQIILNYTTIPLRLMTIGGSVSGLVCIFIGLFFIYRKLVFNVQLGFTATIVVICFGLSIILFCLGIIGEYIRRLYFLQISKPPFTIKEMIE